MKADILCSSRELFGSDRSALRLATALISNGVAPTLVLPANRPERGLSDAAHARGIEVIEAPIAIASGSGLEMPAAIWRRGADSKPDLTIFNSTAVLAAARPVTRRLVIVREWLEPQSLRHRALAKRHQSGCHAVVGISTGVLNQWSRCTRGPRKKWLVHNWLDRATLDEAAAAARSTKERAGILFIGRFNQWKGQDILAEAYEDAFAATDVRPTLTFVGAQPETTFAEQAQGLTLRALQGGWTVRPFTRDPANYFRSAALVVIPSLKPEPFGMVILEALAFGCRVMAFEGGGPTDLAKVFPSAIDLIKRDKACLAVALSQWWEGGGRPLSNGQWTDVTRVLEANFSPATGAAAWSAVLGNLD